MHGLPLLQGPLVDALEVSHDAVALGEAAATARRGCRRHGTATSSHPTTVPAYSMSMYSAVDMYKTRTAKTQHTCFHVNNANHGSE